MRIELGNNKEIWKNHRIKNSRYAECPGGRAEVLYFNLAAAGTTDYTLPHQGKKIRSSAKILCVAVFARRRFCH